MESETSRVMREAEEAAEGGTNRIIDSLAARVGAHADAHAVFGDPVERNGVTVIPVAKVRWGFGGGGGMGWESTGHNHGQDHQHHEAGQGSEHDHHPQGGEGGGGGGGVSASPIGFIEIRDGQASFHRVQDPASLVGLVIAGGISMWLMLRGLKRLVRG